MPRTSSENVAVNQPLTRRSVLRHFTNAGLVCVPESALLMNWGGG